MHQTSPSHTFRPLTASLWWPVGLTVTLLLSLFLGVAGPGANAPGATVAYAAPPRQTPPGVASFDAGLMGVGTPGSIQSYTNTLTNNLGQTKTFNFSAESTRGWSVSVTPPSAVIANGQSHIVVVRVTIPATATEGTMDATMLVAELAPPDLPAPVQVVNTTQVGGDTPLKIPPLQYGEMVDNKRIYQLTAMTGTTQFWPGVDTPTYGYNGTYLGPTLVMTHGETISVTVTNNLDKATTTHWHGFLLPAAMDGGPHQSIAPGTTWHPTFPVHHKAATMWYHPHPHAEEHSGGGHHAAPAISEDHADHADHALQAPGGHRMMPGNPDGTGAQVYSGLAGLVIIRDSESDALGLPQTYGVDDFPLVIQDRGFYEDGSFREFPPIDTGLRKGNYFLVNGTLAANLEAPAQMVRFRVLNGSNARFYRFGFSDRRSFYQIGSDGGLLNAPVERTYFEMGPGERVELVVDLSDAEGQTIYFASFSGEGGPQLTPPHISDEFDLANYVLFSIHVKAPTENPIHTVPTTMNDIVRWDPADAVMTRTFTLNLGPFINNTDFNMEVVNLTATLGTKEIWVVTDLTEEPHPFHIHDDQFQIISRNGEPPPAYEMGWKDTVFIKSGEQVVLLKSFDIYADPDSPFMYHCHMLEHEDDGMMGQFVVVDACPAGSGDIDASGSVDIVDIQRVADDFGNPNFATAHDLNCSGGVDLEDIIKAVLAWE